MPNYFDYAEPVITIGDVPIVQQTFSWSLTAGVGPHIGRILVPKGSYLTNALKQIANPTTLKFILSGGLNGKVDQKIIEFKELHLVQEVESDDFHSIWSLADTRFTWRGLKLYCSYNKTRAINQVGAPSASPSVDPASLRAPFDTFNQGRYLTWSARPDGKPWTMKQIVMKELARLGIPLRSPVDDDAGDYVVENVEYEGVGLYQGLQNLLGRARLQLGIDRDGKAYVYSIDYFDDTGLTAILSNQNRFKTGPGILYKQELKRIRPARVTVNFEKKLETWFINGSSQTNEGLTNVPLRVDTTNPNITPQDFDTGRMIGVENVVRVPFPVGIYKMGEYIPMWRFLQLVGLTDADVRGKWFNGLLEHWTMWLLTSASGGVYLESNYGRASQICSTIRQHYRRVYWIDPYWMDKIKIWEPRRVAIIDNYSRFSSPSPLWVDCCFVPSSRVPSVAKRDASWKTMAKNWKVDIEDAYRLKPTVGTINTINQHLGIFSISFPQDLENVIETIIPSCVDGIPEGAPTAGATSILWSQAKLQLNHVMETMCSIVWQAHRTKGFVFPGKYHEIGYNYTNEGGVGPEVEYLSHLEYARFPLNTIASEGGERGPFFNLIDPCNSYILNALSAAEAAKIMNQYKNRMVGEVIFAGDTDLILNGNINSITTKFSSSGLETIVNAETIPPDPSYEQVLPQNVINFLYRNVSRGDDNNQIGR
jgi:hypothetical protein